jgi:hypothetical protein
MKNVTITLEEKTAAWARLQAARRGVSVSRLVGEMLQERMRQNREYESAMRQWLAKPPTRFKPVGGRYATREELHDRDDLR